IGSVDTRYRIGERGTKETWIGAVGDDAEEATQSLGDGVIAGAFTVRAVLAEAADRAIDELGIDLGQALIACTKTVSRPGTEVLDEHVSFGNETVEGGSIFFAFEIKRDGAFVAIVGLEVRRIVAF